MRFVLCVGLLLAAGCGTAPEPKKEAAPAAKKDAAASPVGAPETFQVRFDTSKGPFVVDVRREWAPRGADRFWELVRAGYFDDARFFRVVKNFVVQFGLAANPATTRKWDKEIDDDPVLRTNRAGAVAFAKRGRHSRTTQIFINLRTNQSLDSQGFAPFGQVVEGMAVVEKLYSGYGEAPEQELIRKRGNAYLAAQFPRLDFVKTAVVVE
ncbi:MAG: peptidylprolyl isomerase [Bryobacteraceae bacterium]